MSSELPRLTVEDIRKQAQAHFRSAAREGEGERRRRLEPPKLLAIFGAGSQDELEVEGLGKLVVLPVRSEIDLRSKLPPLGDDAPHTAYLVPWLGKLPLDLMGRFAKERVIGISSAERLKGLIQAATLSSGLEQSTLARYLLRPGNPVQRYGTPVGHLTEELLWARWLAVEWGFEGEGAVACDTLLAWAAHNAQGSLFVAAMAEPLAQALRGALFAHLKRLGPLGPLAWRCWEVGKGADLLAFAVLCEAIHQSSRQNDAEVKVWLRLNLKSRFDVASGEALAVSEQLATTAPLALRLLQHARGEGAERLQQLAREIVARADQWVDDDVRAAVGGSRRLRAAWSLRSWRRSVRHSPRGRESQRPTP